MNNDDNKSIKCNVESCEYNDYENEYCTLDEIKVSCTCNSCNACKKETICDSLKERKK